MIKIAINGLGRIGRTTLRQLLRDDRVELVAINDLIDQKMMYQLIKYDSVYGRFPYDVELRNGDLWIRGRKVFTSSERNPEDLPWGQYKIDVVIDCTGIFKTYEAASGHLKAGASKVVLSYPVADPAIRSIVLGVNEDELEPADLIVSNASCTTNCTAPVAKVLEDEFGIESGFLTTIHAYTADQNINDASHKDYRRARAAGVNIVPTSTGAANALKLVIPSLEGKLHGAAYRVPVITGSCIDLVVKLKKPASVDAINAALLAASEGSLKGILSYSSDELVSTDIVGDEHSSIFDSKLTAESHGSFKVVSWYDNEFGYSTRLAQLAIAVGEYERVSL